MNSLFLRINAESAHFVGLCMIRYCPFPVFLRKKRKKGDAEYLATKCAGLAFANPLGIAAGFDKNAFIPDLARRLGTGFAEIGTITPLPQKGNVKPRVFRIACKDAVINHLGFPNGGVAKTRKRLAAQSDNPGILGANLGVNRNSKDPIGDYLTCIGELKGLVDYFAINISSPNTPALRVFQQPDNIRVLLDRLCAAPRGKTPIFFKLSPDLQQQEADQLIPIFSQYPIDGLILTNTTIARPAHLPKSAQNYPGGLSGKPLFDRSTAILGYFSQGLAGKIPLIGVGGITDGQGALDKIAAGASLVQIYTGLVYRGFGLVEEILAGMVEYCRNNHLDNISALLGKDAMLWARRFKTLSQTGQKPGQGDKPNQQKEIKCGP